MNAHQRRLKIRAQLRSLLKSGLYPHQIEMTRLMLKTRQKKIVIAWPTRVPNVEDISNYMSPEMQMHQAQGRVHRRPLILPSIADYTLSADSGVIEHADESWLHMILPESEKNKGEVTVRVLKERALSGQPGKYTLNLEGPLVLKELNHEEGEAS